MKKKLTRCLAPASASLLVLLSEFAAGAADKVVIGDIDDMTGVYADVKGPRAVEGINGTTTSSSGPC
jgi:branched-chain amino acid transport system substrate-binding protein